MRVNTSMYLISADVPPQPEHERHPGDESEERRGVAHRRAQRRGQGDHFTFSYL